MEVFEVDHDDICKEGGGHKLVEDMNFDIGKLHYQVLKCSACGYRSYGWWLKDGKAPPIDGA